MDQGLFGGANSAVVPSFTSNGGEVAKRMNIKEQIAALSDNGEFGGRVDPRLWLLLDVADLKALADSHTRLLEAARGVVIGDKPTWIELQAAIKEAESL